MKRTADILWKMIFYCLKFGTLRNKAKVIIFTISLFEMLDAAPLKNLRLYEEALKTEKVSPIFAIPLYEKFLKTDPKAKYESAVSSRLFDLYMEFYKFEDLIHLSETRKIDKMRKLRLERFYQKAAEGIGVSTEVLKDISALSTKNQFENRNNIFKVIEAQNNRKLLEYIFALKLKMGDMEFVDELLKRYSDINPLLRVIHAVKINSKYLKSIVNTYYTSSASQNDRKEIFYMYGIYLAKNNKFKESIRYFKMSESYSEKETGTKILKATNEIAKILYVKGYPEEACKLLQNKRQNSQSESDEFMAIYCDPESSEKLKTIMPALELLAKKDSNLVIRRYLLENLQ